VRLLVSNPIIETYSKLAVQYDDEANARSCWGLASERALAAIRFEPTDAVVLDMGCGTGKAVARLAAQAPPGRQFIAIDPAEQMRQMVLARTHHLPNVRVLDGSFERIPLDAGSVDHLYSIMAFHWTTDLAASVRELARVLKPEGRMDLFFIGRNNGREFIRKTTPIFLKYMGPALLLQSAQMRKQLTREAAVELFGGAFPAARLSVEESYQTYYDTLEGHWGWWVRIEGHFVQIPAERKQACDREVRDGLESLAGPQGIPYTIHQLHVRYNHMGGPDMAD
jgi:ubiquinone/menaquinone biosynthesis C-methylase UbiE